MKEEDRLEFDDAAVEVVDLAQVLVDVEMRKTLKALDDRMVDGQCPSLIPLAR